MAPNRRRGDRRSGGRMGEGSERMAGKAGPSRQGDRGGGRQAGEESARRIVQEGAIGTRGATEGTRSRNIERESDRGSSATRNRPER